MPAVPVDELAKQAQVPVPEERASGPALGYASQPAPELGTPSAPITPWESTRPVEEPLAEQSPWVELSGGARSDVVDAQAVDESAVASADSDAAETEAVTGGYADAATEDDPASSTGPYGADAWASDPSPAADAAEEPGMAQELPVDGAPVSWASDAMDDLSGRGDEAWAIGTVASWDAQALGDAVASDAVDEAAAELADAAARPNDSLPAGEDSGDELGSDAFAFPDLPPGHDPFGPVADVFQHEPLAVGEGVLDEPEVSEATDWSWSRPEGAVEGVESDAVADPANASELAAGAVTNEATTDEVITEHVSEMAIVLPSDDWDEEPGAATIAAAPIDTPAAAALLEAAAETPWPADTPDALEPHGDPLRAELAPEVPMGSDDEARPSAVAGGHSDPATAPTVEPARANLADALATLAERVRAGELQVPGYREEQGEAAALAATLAALLNARR